MLTRNGWTGLLGRIMGSGGMTQDMEKDIEKLKDELDEREGILKRYGETYDGEDEEKEEYTYKGKEYEDYKEKYETLRDDYTELKVQHEGLVTRYQNKFFGGSRDEMVLGGAQVEANQLEKSKRTINDILFGEREV